MSKKTFFLIGIFFFLFLPNIFGVNVNIISNTTLNTTIFYYELNFTDKDNYNSFSFEVPKDAVLISGFSENDTPLFYSKAGDFFIFKPEGRAKNFRIIFSSKKVSESILNSNSYSVYVNLNIPISKLKFTLNLPNNIGRINEVFPRNYLINSENNKIEWELNNLTDYSLFLVKFDKIKNNLNLNKNNNQTNNGYYSYYLIIFIIIIILSLIVIIFKLLIKFKKFELNFKKNNEKLKNKENEPEDENILNVNLSLKEDKENEKIKEEINFEEYLKKYAEKYLTENESKILFIVKDNEGILQNEILDYFPKLTKSSLSKIISKLDSKKVLNRIKVGKVNKIYLGDKFKEFKKN